jgi:hypothetical protein
MEKILKDDLFWSAVLLISLFLLSFRFLTLWFMMDDTSNIYASSQNALKLIFDRDTYLFFNKMFYTPLLPISFKPDFMLFGLRPLGYHMHNMLAAFFTGLIGYKVYRLYLPRFESWAGTFLFVLSYPVITNIGWITRKHYLWGTFFILASFYFFKKSEGIHNDINRMSFPQAKRVGNPSYSMERCRTSRNDKLYGTYVVMYKRGLTMPLISYAFYLVALLFKEAFAPFPAVLFLLSEGLFRERVLKSIPYFLVLGFYLVLRFHIIGGLGGYIGSSPALEPVSLFKNYVAQLSVVSKTLWGIPLFLLTPVLLIMFLAKKPKAIMFALLLVLTTSPFLFLKAPSVTDAYYLFYFPSKFMLPLFIFSGAAASMHAYGKRRSEKILSLVFVCALLALQIMHARTSYAFLKESTESYKELTFGALTRNIQGRDVLIISPDAIFYNFFYGSYSSIAKSAEANLGTVVTIDNPDLFELLPGLHKGELDSVYRDGKWFEKDREKMTNTMFRMDSSIPKPCIETNLKGQFLSLIVTDNRNGSFYGALSSTFSQKNVAVRSMLLPKGVPLKLGLTKGSEVVYLFYCEGGRCSEPLVIRPVL